MGTIVGLYFHTFDDQRLIERQGCVVCELGDQYYLVEYCSWVHGFATNMGIVNISGMSLWRFYKTQDCWREEGEKLNAIAAKRRK